MALTGCSLLSEKSKTETELPLIEIKMADGDFTYLFKGSYLNEWFPVRLSEEDESSFGELRLFGGISRQHPKKSFKVRENSEDDAIILSAQYDDKSLCRYRLSDFLFRKAGFDTPALNYVNVRINESYQGIYLQRENIEEPYFEKRNLSLSSVYKMNLNGSFTFTTGQTASQLFKKTVPDNDLTYTDLIQLITFIDNSLDENHTAQFEELFHIESLLSYIAVSKMISHTDGSQNNVVLYYNPTIHKFQIIPWDLDQTFTGAPKSLPRYDNGLFEKVEAIPEYKDRIHQIVKTVFNADELKEELRLCASEIDETHAYDPYIFTTLDDEVHKIELFIDRVDAIINNQERDFKEK